MVNEEPCSALVATGGLRFWQLATTPEFPSIVIPRQSPAHDIAVNQNMKPPST
jgi:hypothetical protein